MVTLNILAALFAFGVLHSLTAAIPIKALFVSLMGARAYLGLYRLFYNFVSAITLIPLFWLMLVDSGNTVWQFEGILAYIFWFFQGLGALGLLISLLQIDGLRFLGITQAMVWLEGGKLPLADEGLVTGGVYAITRHPLYVFSMLFLWFNPSMSEAMLGLCIGSTIYFVIGSFLEERRLIRDFGADYLAYRRRVAWMIPFLKFPRGD